MDQKLSREENMTTIGIDIGTTSICAVLYDADTGEVCGKATADNAFLPGTEEDGSYAQDPQRIADCAKDLADRLWREDVKAVGISSQMHGILYVDAEGRACSPFFTWKNGYGNRIYREGKSYASWLGEKTGQPMASGYGSVTHFFLQENGRIPDAAVRMVNIGDYLAMRLTGKSGTATDASLAASFGGFDLKGKRFLAEALRKAGVDIRYYPSVSGAEAVVGEYRSAAVFGACGDNQASFLGAVDDPKHSINVNVGTGSQVSVFHEELLETGAADIRPFFGKGYLYVGATLTGGKAYEKLAAFFEETFSKAAGIEADGYQVLEKLLAGVEETDLQVCPSIYGSRDGLRTEGFLRNWKESNFHPGDLVFGFIDGMAKELADLFDSMPDGLKEGKCRIIASGNGLRRNGGLVRATRRRFGMPVSFSSCEEEAAFGAARYAAGALERA